MTGTLEDRVALVTGGAARIGAEICRTLAREGAIVAIHCHRSLAAAEDLVEEIEANGGEAFVVRGDLAEDDDRSALIDAVIDRAGRLDILVNNAAWNIGIPFPELDKLTVDVWDRVLETNLRAPFLLARAAADLLKADGGGHIVNISSAGGISLGSRG